MQTLFRAVAAYSSLRERNLKLLTLVCYLHIADFCYKNRLRLRHGEMEGESINKTEDEKSDSKQISISIRVNKYYFFSKESRLCPLSLSLFNINKAEVPLNNLY